MSAVLSSSRSVDLILIRHGSTFRNDGIPHRIQGQDNLRDCQLNKAGEEQAQKVGRLMQACYPNISPKIYTSDLGRSKRTADLATTHIANRTIIEEVGAREINHADMDNTLQKERNDTYKQFYETLIASQKEEAPDPLLKHKRKPPQYSRAESSNDLYLRARTTLLTIAEENVKESRFEAIAVFTHGAFISTMKLRSEHAYGRAELVNGYLPLYTECPSIPNCAAVRVRCHLDQTNEDLKIEFIGIENLEKMAKERSQTTI